MKKRFVVGINAPSDQAVQSIRDFFRSKKYGWWNWITNFWLVIDWEGKLSAGELRDELGKIVPGENILVLDVSDSRGWSGFGPSTDKANMFKWIQERWSRK